MPFSLLADRDRGVYRTLALAAVASAFACAPTSAPRGGDDDAPATGGGGALGGTGGTSGAQSGGSGTGAGAGIGSGGTTALGGATNTGGSAVGGQGGVGPSGGTGGTGGAPGGAGSGAAAGDASTGGASGGAGAGGSVSGAGGAGGSGGGGGVPRPCGHPGEFFCDDFESVTMLDTARWAIEKNGTGTVEIDGSMGHSGTKSVHVSQVGYNAFATLKGAGGLFSTGSRYIRVFMRLATPMTGGHNTYFIAGLLAMQGAPYETRIGVMNEMLMINQPNGDRGFLSNQNYYVDHLPGAVIAANTWACVEVFLDPPNRTINVWLEDQAIPDLSRTDWQQESFDVVRFGFERYAGPDSQVWYDDIAVGTQKIGCR